MGAEISSSRASASRLDRIGVLAVCAALLLSSSAIADGESPREVTICHQPGTPAERTLVLPEAAAAQHVAEHGDTPGACGALNVRPRLEVAGRAAARITRAGGSISARSPDGFTFTLTIPRGALSQSELITLTPLAGIDGLPAGARFVAGVQVEPHGLLLAMGGSLDVRKPDATAARGGFFDAARQGRVRGFGYRGEGHEFHLKRANASGDRFGLKVNQFSGYGLISAQRECEALVPVPGSPEATLEQDLACVTQEDLDRRGSEMADKVIEYANTHLFPAFAVADTFAEARLAMFRWTFWLENAQALEGLDERIGPVIADTTRGVTAMLVALAADLDFRCTVSPACEVISPSFQQLVVIQSWAQDHGLDVRGTVLARDVMQFCGALMEIAITGSESPYFRGIRDGLGDFLRINRRDVPFATRWTSSRPSVAAIDELSGFFTTGDVGSSGIAVTMERCTIDTLSRASATIEVMETHRFPLAVEGTQTVDVTIETVNLGRCPRSPQDFQLPPSFWAMCGLPIGTSFQRETCTLTGRWNFDIVLGLHATSSRLEYTGSTSQVVTGLATHWGDAECAPYAGSVALMPDVVPLVVTGGGFSSALPRFFHNGQPQPAAPVTARLTGGIDAGSVAGFLTLSGSAQERFTFDNGDPFDGTGPSTTTRTRSVSAIGGYVLGR